jgi:DNA repair protein RadD
MITLFPDQERSVEGLREAIRRKKRSPLLVSPTGSGKTVIFSYLTWKLTLAGRRVACLAHREELIEQISLTQKRFDVPHGIIAAGMDYNRNHLAHVASVATLVRRLKFVIPPDYVVVDEAHHAILGSMYGTIIEAWREANPNLIVIGVTATPERLSGEGLGQVFDYMVMGPTTAELIKLGRLSPYKLYTPPQSQQLDLSSLRTRAGEYAKDDAEAAVDKPAIIGSAVTHYRQHLNGAPAVAFCASRAHAEHVAEQFRTEGWRAASIDGTMDKTTRRNINRDFGTGQLHVLTSCDLISEGYDVPGIVGVIGLRPTQSLALYLQQVGRGLRTAPGKSHAVILDHVGNSMRYVNGELQWNHGLPDDEREWSLEGQCRKAKADKDPDEIAVKQCKVCFAHNRAFVSKCRECGAPFVVSARVIEEREGVLEEVDPEVARAAARRSQAAARSIEEMVSKLGYKESRAQKIVEAREEKQRLRDQVSQLSMDWWELGGDPPLHDGFIRALKPKELKLMAEAFSEKIQAAIEAKQARLVA